MAATIIYKDGREKIWHVGQKPFSEKSQILNVVKVWIDGDEAELIHDFELDRLEGCYPNFLKGQAAFFYCVIIFHLYGHCPQPKITEQGITTLMQGMSERDKN